MKKTKIFDAIAVFLIAIFVILFLSSLLFSWFGIYATLVSELLLILPAYFLIILRNEPVSERFGLKLPSIKDFFSAAAMLFGVNMLQNAVTYFLYPIYYKNAENTDISYLDSFSEVNPIIVLLVVAVAPAICEEMLFRGYFLSAFGVNQSKKRAFWGITVSALMFSLMHFSIYKLPFTLALGLAFGYIAYKSNSILLTAIFHFLSNANSLISYYTLKNADNEEAISFILKDTTYIFIGVICLCFSLVLISLGIKLFSGKKSKKGFKIFIIVLLITAALISTLSLLFATVNEMKQVVSATIEEDSYAQNFELEKNTMCFVFAAVPAEATEVVILDSKGETVYEYTPESTDILTLEKGSYTLSVNTDTELAENTIAVKCVVQIFSFAEYEKTSEQLEENKEPGGIDFN